MADEFGNGRARRGFIDRTLIEHLAGIAVIITAGVGLGAYYSGRSDVHDQYNDQIKSQISQLQSEYANLNAQVSELQSSRILTGNKLEIISSTLTTVSTQFQDFKEALKEATNARTPLRR